MSPYLEIVDELVITEHAETGRWFSLPCLRANGYIFAALWQDRYLVVKLQGDDHRKALALSGARLFDPSEENRPMREWVQVPESYAEQWPELARSALEYVRSLPPKVKKNKK